MAIKGKGVLINVNTGTDALPVWTKVAGQKGATLNRSVESIEATTKDADSKEFLGGYDEWSVEADGLLQLGDLGFKKLEDAFMAKQLVKVQFKMPSGDLYSGMALITDLPLEAPMDDLVTYSVTLMGSGTLLKTSV